MRKKEDNLPLVLENQIIPVAQDIECSVLGMVLLDNTNMVEIWSDFNPNLFAIKENKLIAEVIYEMYKNDKAIDIMTLTVELNQKQLLKEVGGPYYITNLTSKVVSSANINFYIKILQQKFLERSIVYICNKNLQRVLDFREDVFDVFANLQLELDNCLKDVLRYEVSKISEIHYDIIFKMSNVIEKGIKSGVPTGFTLLDNVTNGWQDSDLIILAGRPSMGKTACAVSMIIHPSIEKQIPVAIFSLEMSKFQLGGRIQSYISEINVSKIIKSQLNIDELRVIIASCESLDKAPLYIDDTPNISLLELKSKSRKLVKENGVRLIVIDYLQLMRSGLNIMHREQEIAEISRGLKALAKELNIPVIALSQLSRTVESRGDKKPMLSDLRESGQIEQDADMVIFTYRPEYYGIEQYEIGSQNFETFGLMMLLVAKHRNGELGEIPLRFVHENAKIKNYNNLLNSNTFAQENQNNVIQVNQSNVIQNNTDFLNQQPPF
jgi:replicative DNA helicase